MSVLTSRRGAHRTSPALAQIGSLIQGVAVTIAVIIGIGIVLVVIKANPGNDIVRIVQDVAGWLGTPFADLLTVPDRTTRLIANWGLAAGVYLVLGTLLGRALIGRGLRRRR